MPGGSANVKYAITTRPACQIIVAWGQGCCKVAFVCQCESSPTGTMGRRTRPVALNGRNLTLTLQIVRVEIVPVKFTGTPSSICHCETPTRGHCESGVCSKQSHHHIGDCARGDCARKAHGYGFVYLSLRGRFLAEAISPSHWRLRAWGLRALSARVRLRLSVTARAGCARSNLTDTRGDCFRFVVSNAKDEASQPLDRAQGQV